MKKIIIIIIVIIIGFLIKIPEYEELNNLAIIESIGVSHNDKNYTIYLKEIIPSKDEQGINYKYEYYKGEGKTIKKALDKLNQKTKRKIYLKRCKNLITNLKYSKNIIKDLNINPENIHHTQEDVYKVLKKTN